MIRTGTSFVYDTNRFKRSDKRLSKLHVELYSSTNGLIYASQNITVNI
jgi:hypothetical protein